MANSKRACKHCKDYTRDFILIKGLGAFCNFEHVMSYTEVKRTNARDRAIAKQARAVKARDKAYSKDLRDFNRKQLSWQHKQTQPVFNKMRVLQEHKWFRDRGLTPTCISCNKPDMDFCCGHLKTVGAQGLLRYDPINNYLQCNAYCNKGLSANLSGNKTTRGYIKGLIERFGQEEGQKIIDYCETNNALAKWDWEELEKFRAECAKEVRKLKKELA